MSKHSRNQSIIAVNQSEDKWFSEMEKNLNKISVTTRTEDSSLFDQINSVINNSQSKYKSVQHAVDDMRERSGLSKYNSKISAESKEKSLKSSKASDENNVIDKTINIPIIFKSNPDIKKTLENYISDTKGNLSIPAIINKIKAIHHSDVTDSSAWDEDNFLRFVAKLNLKEKANHYNSGAEHNLGKLNNDNDSTLDSSNMNAFDSLNPATF